MALYGLDLSNNNVGPIDFVSLKNAGLSFMFHKASQGTNFSDGYLPQRWAAIRAAGLLRGGYHFMDNSAPEAQAAWFLSCMHAVGLSPEDMVALDIEDLSDMGPGDLSPQCLIWGDIVGRAVGYKPLLYSNLAFFQAHLTNPALPRVFNCWPAAWGPTVPTAPAPFSHVDLWQDSATFSYPGLLQVDHDVFLGTMDQLRALGKPAPLPPTPVTTTTVEQRAANSWLYHVQGLCTGVHIVDSPEAKAAVLSWIKNNP